LKSDYTAGDVPLTIPDNITAAQKQQFLVLLSHYTDIIARRSDDLGHTTVMQHSIDTGNATPIRQQLEIERWIRLEVDLVGST